MNLVFERIQRIGLIVGIIGLVLCVVGVFLDFTVVMQSYLLGYIFWVGISMGCLALLMIQFAVKGHWGLAIRRLLEAGALTIPLMALLFIPVLLGMSKLYPWVGTEPSNSAYLNVPFFIVRAIVYFVVWSAIAVLLRRLSRREDHDMGQQMQNLSVWGAVIFSITATFAMIDWIMSLEPAWSSSIYAVMVVMGGVLAAFALVIAILTRLPDSEPLTKVVTPALLNDLGNLLLSGLLMWAYLAFSQYLVIWTGNLSDEIPWYLRRLDGGWQVVVLLIIVLHFVVPFVLLLSPQIKRHARTLGMVAMLLLVMHIVDVFWLVIPALRQNGVAITWTDVAAPIGIGGLWVAAFFWQLKQSSLLARDTQVIENRETVTNG